MAQGSRHDPRHVEQPSRPTGGRTGGEGAGVGKKSEPTIDSANWPQEASYVLLSSFLSYHTTFLNSADKPFPSRVY